MAKPTTIASNIYPCTLIQFANTHSYSRYAFATFDTNHDGSIEFDEFLLSMSATSSGDLDQRLAVAFDM